MLLFAASMDAGEARHSVYSPDAVLLAEGTAGTVEQEYVWFAGVPVAQFDGGAMRFTFADHLGTPLLQTGADTAVAWRAEHEPYGEVHALRAGGGLRQPLRLPGQESDESTGERAYNVNRWYRASWGRYSTFDPWAPGGGGTLFVDSHVFLAGADPETWHVREHPYAYALANPSAYVDPLGLMSAARVCCDGAGGFTVCRGEDTITDELKSTCIEEHERDHVDFLRVHCPDQCKDPVTGLPRPRGWYHWRMTESMHNGMECRGYEAEVKCIRKNISKANGPQDVMSRVSGLKAKARQQHQCQQTAGW